jgi:hypothetical protein
VEAGLGTARQLVGHHTAAEVDDILGAQATVAICPNQATSTQYAVKSFEIGGLGKISVYTQLKYKQAISIK